ncbi:MAG: helix-turn-helix transcriptional regulator [Bacteroidales bacterium]|jgi:AraC-like DNA-binding protein|nr:helix-turn-helix transcriptional regulator [Bacteroidales bacterium]
MKKWMFCICAVLLLAGCTWQETVKPSESLKEARQDYNRGLEYDQAWQFRLAEVYYGKVYRTMKENPAEDWWLYGEAGFRYAHLLSERGDLEGAVAVLGEVLAQAQENEEFPAAQLSTLLTKMAYCQRKLNQFDAAKQTYDKAYKVRVKEFGGECTGNINMVVLCDCAFLSIFEMGEYDEAALWLQRADAELEAFLPQGDSALIENYSGLNALYHVRLLQASGHSEEASALYDSIPRNRLFTPLGVTTAVLYLMDAARYDEAADLYATIDTTFSSFYPSHITFDVVHEHLAPRYMALRRAGHTADALEMADSIVGAIDSALAWQKRSDAAELSVIYQTHEKELALQKSNTRATIYRLLAVAALLLLLLTGYILWRVRRDNSLLTEKNRLLYEQIRQHEEAEDKKRELQQAQPTESLTTNQLLYHRLCELMQNPDVFCNPEANHETLARLAGTNYKYVYNALRECADTTPADFINQHRIRHAALLLATTDNPVGLIGEKCGFTNRSTFARLFRNQYSMTPSEYRSASKKSNSDT